MSRKTKKVEAEKPLGLRASGLAEWLESLDDSASLVRAVRLWWHRKAIFGLALEALDALAELEKKNGPHDKIRRAAEVIVRAMGGAELKWADAKAKGDD